MISSVGAQRFWAGPEGDWQAAGRVDATSSAFRIASPHTKIECLEKKRNKDLWKAAKDLDSYPCSTSINWMRLGEEIRGVDASFVEGRASKAGPSGIDIVYERLGDPDASAVLEAIPGAELLLIEGMGHDLPRALQTQIAARIAEFAWRPEGR